MAHSKAESSGKRIPAEHELLWLAFEVEAGASGITDKIQNECAVRSHLTVCRLEGVNKELTTEAKVISDLNLRLRCSKRLECRQFPVRRESVALPPHPQRSALLAP